MISSTLLSPALLHAMAVFLAAICIVQIAAFSGILALAAQGSTLSPRGRLTVPLTVAALLAAWLAWAVLAVNDPVMAPEPPPGAPNLTLLVMMAVFATLGMAALFVSRSIQALAAATPPAWTVGVQAYRIAGIFFLWPFLASGALHPTFALLAGIGDILTGLMAVRVALALHRGEPGVTARAVAWNWFGIADFVTAVSAAVLTQSSNIARFPLVIVPLFIVPLGLLAHVYSLRTLAAARRSATDRFPERHAIQPAVAAD